MQLTRLQHTFLGYALSSASSLDDELVGRTYDLRSAYKQFGVSAETRERTSFIGLGCRPTQAIACWV